jgi:hypothetical protein
VSSSRYTIVSWILIQENENKPKNMRKKKQREREREREREMIASISTEVSEHPVLRHKRKKKKLCHSLHEHKQIINDPVFSMTSV